MLRFSFERAVSAECRLSDVALEQFVVSFESLRLKR